MIERVAEFFAANSIGPSTERSPEAPTLSSPRLQSGLAARSMRSLPFDVATFVEISVDTTDAEGAAWRKRFENLLSACRSVTIAQPGRPACAGP